MSRTRSNYEDFFDFDGTHDHTSSMYGTSMNVKHNPASYQNRSEITLISHPPAIPQPKLDAEMLLTGESPEVTAILHSDQKRIAEIKERNRHHAHDKEGFLATINLGRKALKWEKEHPYQPLPYCQSSAHGPRPEKEIKLKQEAMDHRTQRYYRQHRDFPDQIQTAQRNITRAIDEKFDTNISRHLENFKNDPNVRDLLDQIQSVRSYNREDIEHKGESVLKDLSAKISNISTPDNISAEDVAQLKKSLTHTLNRTFQQANDQFGGQIQQAWDTVKSHLKDPSTYGDQIGDAIKYVNDQYGDQIHQALDLAKSQVENSPYRDQIHSAIDTVKEHSDDPKVWGAAAAGGAAILARNWMNSHSDDDDDDDHDDKDKRDTDRDKKKKRDADHKKKHDTKHRTDHKKKHDTDHKKKRDTDHHDSKSKPSRVEKFLRSIPSEHWVTDEVKDWLKKNADIDIRPNEDNSSILSRLPLKTLAALALGTGAVATYAHQHNIDITAVANEIYQEVVQSSGTPADVWRNVTQAENFPYRDQLHSVIDTVKEHSDDPKVWGAAAASGAAILARNWMNSHSDDDDDDKDKHDDKKKRDTDHKKKHDTDHDTDHHDSKSKPSRVEKFLRSIPREHWDTDEVKDWLKKNADIDIRSNEDNSSILSRLPLKTLAALALGTGAVATYAHQHNIDITAVANEIYQEVVQSSGTPADVWRNVTQGTSFGIENYRLQKQYNNTLGEFKSMLDSVRELAKVENPQTLQQFDQLQDQWAQLRVDIDDFLAKGSSPSDLISLATSGGNTPEAKQRLSDLEFIYKDLKALFEGSGYLMEQVVEDASPQLREHVGEWIRQNRKNIDQLAHISGPIIGNMVIGSSAAGGGITAIINSVLDTISSTQNQQSDLSDQQQTRQSDQQPRQQQTRHSEQQQHRQSEQQPHQQQTRQSDSQDSQHDSQNRKPDTRGIMNQTIQLMAFSRDDSEPVDLSETTLRREYNKNLIDFKQRLDTLRDVITGTFDTTIRERFTELEDHYQQVKDHLDRWLAHTSTPGELEFIYKDMRALYDDSNILMQDVSSSSKSTPRLRDQIRTFVTLNRDQIRQLQSLSRESLQGNSSSPTMVPIGSTLSVLPQSSTSSSSSRDHRYNRILASIHDFNTKAQNIASNNNNDNNNIHFFQSDDEYLHFDYASGTDQDDYDFKASYKTYINAATDDDDDDEGYVYAQSFATLSDNESF